MALFTDGSPAVIEYLRSYESATQDVAAAEGIDLDLKLALAAEEIGDDILRFIGAHGAHLTADSLNSDRLASVVVTAALRRWHAIHALELVYRDAYGSQLNERYTYKMNEYTAAARRAGEAYFQLGVGIVQKPVPKAPLPQVAGFAVDVTPYFARVAWVGQDGSEGAPCDAVVVDIGNGSTLSISPPDADVAGWNVYLGTSRDSIYLQNIPPVPLGAAWIFNGVADTESRGARSGQVPDYFIVDYRRLQRG